MLIEVHYGEACVLLVNGNCRPVHLLNYIRTHCCLSSTVKLDLCLISNGEPLHLATPESNFFLTGRRRYPAHIHCVLTEIDDEGTYTPLLNDATLLTNDFLAKLKKATSLKTTPKPVPKSGKPSTNPSDDEAKRRRSIKSVVIAAGMMNKINH
ncbi:unnamed protein product [Rotaria socialis]|uniref:Uncharacterized protein n=2 Tax=Rotaria socialis TaxID=392032 RepID=A0A817TNF3_9BILA|nr:unnamed protein product [Rotaria socialis]